MPFSSIIDNQSDNTLLGRFAEISSGGRQLNIATAFFSIDALLMLSDHLDSFESVRILFGDDADAKQRVRLLDMLRLRSDEDLLAQREVVPQLSPLKRVEALFASGRVEARCYTSKKFHAKAYLIQRDSHPRRDGILGSGNLTRAGLTQNVELNLLLTIDQSSQLEEWFGERWAESSADVVTSDVLSEIRRQLDLYDPYVLYLKALFAWGKSQQDDSAVVGGKLTDALDAHQEQAYRQALKILDLQHGVMICDGVGLGKSYVALALMERFCRANERVLLLAPKNILEASWNEYIAKYLDEYHAPYGSIDQLPMTSLGFDADEESDSPAVRKKTDVLRRFAERADVIVIDESHNFRTTAASRYKNLLKLVGPQRGKRKKIILLTATPINTAYRDITSQLSLITYPDGSIGGYGIDQIRRFGAELDKQNTQIGGSAGQLSFDLAETPSDGLRQVLENVLIQRSRKTCKALALARGKELRFPVRSDPQCLDYAFGPANERYRALIALTDSRFRPGVNRLKKLQEELQKAEHARKSFNPDRLLSAPLRGIKLAAFLTEQYRREPAIGSKVYRDEVHLARLVFANALKQLESSPAAFQGIVQNLGLGLIARLHHALGEQNSALLIAPHRGWVRTPLFDGSLDAERSEDVASDADDDPEGDLADEGDTLDASGDEADDWLARAIRQRSLKKKLKDFNDDIFEVARWRDDIVSDLGFLREIHEATLKARQQPDPKLQEVQRYVSKLTGEHKRVLVFTQSQRTAEYLERAFKGPDGLGSSVGIARIDSRIEKTRTAILHAFSPGYNAIPAGVWPRSVPERVDVLISTDVLSEGVNLQEASAIINYDIHWNPVRLIQRIGRVDRRLNPAITPETHSFAIYNVLPPPEIEGIINLIGAVENRTLKISRTLGLDVSFFKSTDPAGSLIEFNGQYDGKITKTDDALNHFVRLTSIAPPDDKTKRLLDALPAGAFGVWKGAPQNGVFALFTMEPTKKALPGDHEKFAAIIGQPVLSLSRAGSLRPLFDAGEILSILAGTSDGERSGTPSDEQVLAEELRKLKRAVRQKYAEINLPQTILPKLVCWIELRA